MGFFLLQLFASTGVEGAVVGPGGYTNSFNVQPAAADWATYGRPGAPSDSYDMESDVNANITEASVNLLTKAVAANPPVTDTNATWSSTGFYLQTRPKTVRYIALMGKFVNNTGTNATQIRVSYQYSLTGNGPAEDSGKGTRVYYSLSGQLNSWTNIPALNYIANADISLKMSVDLSINWSHGASLYLLWVDDNSNEVGSDAANQIDNFSLQVISDQPPDYPPSVSLASPAEACRIPPGTSFNLRAAVSDPNDDVAFVEFFDGSASLGVTTDPPYSVVWENPLGGIHLISARATDAAGLRATSAPVLVQVLIDQATLILHPGFSNAAHILIEGSAATVGNRLRLTPAVDHQTGSAWLQDYLLVQYGFETVFQFQISEAGNSGADGFAFVLFNGDVPPLGDVGGAMGYGSMPSSLAVEFDTWLNAEGGDPDGNHIAVHSRGAAPNSTDESASLGRVSPSINLSDGAVHTVIIRYSFGALKVYLDNLVTPVLTVTVNVASLLGLQDGSAWVGFTAGTGDGYENHDILMWSFRPNTPPQLKLVSPEAGPFLAPTNLVIAANAADTDGEVSQVEFLVNGVSLGTVTNSPFSMAWNNPRAGSYVLRAIAADDFGGRTTSPPLNVAVFNVSQISRITPGANGNTGLEFLSTVGQTYAVQYSSDLLNWTNAIPAMIGSGGLTTWQDTNAPVVDPAGAQRFYRLFVTP